MNFYCFLRQYPGGNLSQNPTGYWILDHPNKILWDSKTLVNPNPGQNPVWDPDRILQDPVKYSHKGSARILYQTKDQPLLITYALAKIPNTILDYLTTFSIYIVAIVNNY